VRLLAVRFDDEALVAPHEVAHVALNAAVHLGPGEASAGTELEEQLLELGERPGAARRVNGEH
jgi:hypothetical protein